MQIEVEMRKLCAFEVNCAQKNVEFEIDNLNSKWFFSHLKLKGTQGYFWLMLSSNPSTYFEQEVGISNSKIRRNNMDSGGDQFEIHSEFQTYFLNFEFVNFPSRMSLKLIWNSSQF